MKERQTHANQKSSMNHHNTTIKYIQEGTY